MLREQSLTLENQGIYEVRGRGPWKGRVTMMRQLVSAKGVNHSEKSRTPFLKNQKINNKNQKSKNHVCKQNFKKIKKITYGFLRMVYLSVLAVKGWVEVDSKGYFPLA